MSMKFTIPIDVDQSSTSDVDPTNVPEIGGDASSGDSTSTLNTENYSLQTHDSDQSLPNAKIMKRTGFQSCSIGAADPMLESSKLLRKLSEALGMSVSL